MTSIWTPWRFLIGSVQLPVNPPRSVNEFAVALTEANEATSSVSKKINDFMMILRLRVLPECTTVSRKFRKPDPERVDRVAAGSPGPDSPGDPERQIHQSR